jgi:uncharacterized membrane protein YqaE (UPF0057 family)
MENNGGLVLPFFLPYVAVLLVVGLLDVDTNEFWASSR